MVGMYLVHEPLLRNHFTFSWPLTIVAFLFLGISAYLNACVYKKTPLSMALGLNELSTDSPGKLITTGIYSRIRHPRFSAMALAVVAMAMITGYAALYVLIVIYVVGIYVIVLLEERELLLRFGSKYLDYAKRVPRFTPHIKGRPSK